MTYSRNPKASALVQYFTNVSGSTFSKGQPISVDLSSGNIDNVDIMSESAASAFAVCLEEILPTNKGMVTQLGRIEDIENYVACNFGDTLYISELGGLTPIAPTTSGAMLIEIGIVVKNQTDPLKKDLIVNIDLRGQL